MKRFFPLFFIILSSAIFAQDTVIVETLNFNMITQRKGKFVFPDNPNEFRKILMLYTLKCDTRTTHDQYPCGEWDYLTHNIVFKPTGEKDSTAKQHPFFKLGWESPTSLDYTTKKTTTSYQKKFYRMHLSAIDDEESFEIGTPSKEIVLSDTIGRIQMSISSKELRDFGLTKGNIDKLALYIKEHNNALMRIAIRIKNAPTGNLTDFTNYGFDTVFYSDFKFEKTGWQEFDFLKSYNWTGFSGIMIDIAYELISGSAPVLMFTEATNVLMTNQYDEYLNFKTPNDAVIFRKQPSDVYGAEKLTMEGWVRVDKWQAWNRVFGNSNTTLELGNNVGQIYCIVRNPDNTHGNARSVLTMGEWQHIAMVFNGSAQSNDDKLILYVNGQRKTLQFSGNIPNYTNLSFSPLSISGNGSATQSLFGAIDEVRFWNDALSEDDIRNWYNRKINPSHPKYSSLFVYFDFDDDNDLVTAKDKSINDFNGSLVGIPVRMKSNPMELKLDIIQSEYRPVLKFFRADYTKLLDSVIYNIVVDNPPLSIVKYKIENYNPVPYEIEYAWRAGYTYSYDGYGRIVDSVYNPKEKTIINDTLFYFNEPFDVVEQFEIGRFITPYGINLDLGPTGFTWVYDVTDYAPLLKDTVDFQAGNQQELIDVKFLFIRGTAPRDVLKIHQLWGPYRSYSYKSMSDNTSLSETEVKLLPQSKQFKVITRLSGHGHQSNDGNYPHCCEWKNNNHYLLVNGQQAANWNIWQTNDCALNPVYPQGGTWPGAREGWCPGDVVKDFNFEITKYITGATVNIDYDITKVPTNNLGMGNGNYIVNMHLIEYSDFKFNLDAEVYNVIMPSRDSLYSRKNPICSNPIVIVRNNGRDDIAALEFRYNVSGGKEEIYNWSGKLEPNEMMTVSLPVSGSQFWMGDGSNRFYVQVSLTGDEYSDNDSFISDFRMPDLYSGTVVIEYKTNNRPGDFIYNIKDILGNVVRNKSGLMANQVYKDTLNFDDGCYTFEFTDINNLGLSYWAYPAQGSGYVRFTDINGKPLRTFNPDCGRGYHYSFNLGDVTFVQTTGFDDFLQVFPNPSGDYIALLLTYAIGKAEINIIDVNGNILHKEIEDIAVNSDKKIQIKDLPKGIYFVRIINDKFNLTQKFIKR